MKRLIFLFCFLFTGASIALAADRRIAFEQGNAVHIANLDVTIVRKLADGVMPAISPDATRVAFRTVEKSPTTYARHLSVVETASGKITAFKSIPSDNSYAATWSPTGEWLAFIFTTNGILRLGTIKADGTDFKFIKSATGSDVPLYSPCWARDGWSIFCHDSTNLYRLRLVGSILTEWKIEKIVPNGAMGADGRIEISPNGQRLLLSIDMDEEHNRKDWDGPVPALWSFDLATQTAVRLTSKNLFAWDGCWLDDANIAFLSQRSGQKEASIYRTDGKSIKRLMENARRPSVSK